MKYKTIEIKRSIQNEGDCWKLSDRVAGDNGFSHTAKVKFSERWPDSAGNDVYESWYYKARDGQRISQLHVIIRNTFPAELKRRLNKLSIIHND